MKLNLNDNIKVKLTDLGKDIYYHQYDNLNAAYGVEICKPKRPKVDEDGYTTFQLWAFIELYGGHIGMGLPNVIEPIEIVFDVPTTEERKTMQWIPCSDKIPSESQECWITAKDGTVCQGMFTRQYGERRDSGFICNNGFAWLNTVVAWMPYDMPEPYQKEGGQE